MPEEKFLSVNSSLTGDLETEKTPRSFLMQKIRTQRPWSTKSANRRKPATRTRKPAGVSRSSSKSSTPPTSSPKPRPKATAPSKNSPPAESLIDPSLTASDSAKPLGVKNGSGTQQPTRSCSLCGGQVAGREVLCLQCDVLHHGPGTPPAWAMGNGEGPTFFELLTAPLGSGPTGSQDSCKHVVIDQSINLRELIVAVLGALPPTILPLSLGSQREINGQGWFSLSTANGAFMHSFLCVKALHRYVTIGTGTYDEILQHRAAAIAAVNENISDAQTALGDANLAAVFNLLCVEETMVLPSFSSKTGDILRDPAHRDLHLQS
jgi:hypothetical protein